MAEGDPFTDEARQSLASALQGVSRPADIEQAVLCGWVVVSEWMAPDGEKWIAKIACEGATGWQIDGYLLHALHKMDDE